MRSRGSKFQSASGLSFDRSQASAAFKDARDAAPMPQSAEDLKRFAVFRMGRYRVALLAGDRAQIGERTSATPAVSGFSKCGKGAPIQFAGRTQITLFTGYVTLLIDGPGGPAAITQRFEYFCGFAQRPASSCIVAADLNDVGEIVQATRDG